MNLMLRMWGILIINATNDWMKRFRVASYNDEPTAAISQNVEEHRGTHCKNKCDYYIERMGL